MKLNRENLLLYAVTDRKWTGEHTLYEQVEAALKGGATCVQLREKCTAEEEFLSLAKSLVTLCHSYNVPLIINDNVEIAVKCGADGVHVGQDDMSAADVRKIVGEDMIIGVSSHNVAEARKAAADGADYLGAGAVFATSTKSDAGALPHSELKKICESVNIPVVAIGGITRDNIPLLRGNGIAGVALVSAVFAAEDIENECKQLLKIVEDTVK